jgi:hypothetical protein
MRSRDVNQANDMAIPKGEGEADGRFDTSAEKIHKCCVTQQFVSCRRFGMSYVNYQLMKDLCVLKL